ncbi:energy-coupling factor transporter transmembrane component T family protein [Antrihabitans stalactiti]|uniref:Energy-coupling factor transporter transmembrane protein EcfT n=1 Tax=Antrihabitans stalactiti TaxID=2584121 RepID=A0A848KFJ4_9NOCA|nr:energy-coupling factor transporter transmembrane protein EcfT [Antrihabitans stalactiti]NMN96506.1 energy-coupling factor transporter transmembrane protein EcfT [Antrihabitans stalactiti]
MSTVLLRRVPGDTVIHRLWAGTKLLAVLAVSLLLMFLPTWPVLGMITAVLVFTAVAARVPLGALPRLPWWFWFLMSLGIVVNAPIGLEAVVRYLQITVFAFLLLFASMMIAWTTPMNEIAPAISTLGAPLRKLRLPVDEWAVAVALCLRSLPLLIEEMRVLRAARQLRPKGGRPQNARDNGLIDIVTAAMAVAMRRAGELGEAITARGGTGQLTAYESRPGRSDAVALVLIAVVSVAGVVMGIAL